MLDLELAIGEVSERSGLAVSAIRFYEDKGLIASTRTSGGQRRFRRDVLRRLAFIQAAQRVGLSLDEIGAAMATLPGDAGPTGPEWKELSASWRPLLDERIELLDGAAGSARPLHRLRLPLPRAVQAEQPWRPGRPARRRRAVPLGGWPGDPRMIPSSARGGLPHG